MLQGNLVSLCSNTEIDELPLLIEEDVRCTQNVGSVGPCQMEERGQYLGDLVDAKLAVALISICVVMSLREILSAIADRLGLSSKVEYFGEKKPYSG